MTTNTTKQAETMCARLRGMNLKTADEAADLIELLSASKPAAFSLMTKDHKGMRVNYSGMLGEAQRALGSRNPGIAEMLRQLQGHIAELGRRWYAGDTAVVDEFLQLYCVETDARVAALAAAPAAPAQSQEPYLYVYEYESGYFGLHREFSPIEWNAMRPTRTVPLYTAPPSAQPAKGGETCSECGGSASIQCKSKFCPQSAVVLDDERAAFERCAQICEGWAQSIDTGKKRNRVVAAAMQGALTCAAKIRSTSPQFAAPQAAKTDAESASSLASVMGDFEGRNGNHIPSDSLYTMDEMRDYAQAFHKSRRD